jgi:endonuclease/exonuclease/phosphatase family metal-dependent hydrolase
MNKQIFAFLGATCLAWGFAAAAGDFHDDDHDRDRGHDSRGWDHDRGRGNDIEVMTQNQYLGGDIAPVIATAGTPQFNAAVVAALQQVAASHTPERMKALAGEILDRRPDLVALQEVWKFECVPVPGLPLPPGVGCDDPSIRAAFNDHLELTRSALGRAYADVAQVTNLDIQFFQAGQDVYPGIPFEVNGVPAFLRVTDRDVILARKDVARTASPVDFGCARVSGDGCNYEVVVELDLIGRVERGFVGVDVTVNHRKYRFVNTHLETRDPPLPAAVQAAQMSELLGRLLLTSPSRRLILAGDFNSDPGEAADPYPTPYMQALGVGLYDAWLLGSEDSAGLTCCQAADLRNRKSQLSQRIDLLFLREMPSRVRDAEVLGVSRRDRIGHDLQGLWPSDHGAVAATLYYR